MPVTPCAKVIKYAPATCGVKPGGIARIGIADATLWDFTQSAPVSGVPQPYTVLTDLGTGSLIYGVQFTRQQAEYAVAQKNTDGVVASYDHSITFSVPDISQLTEQWATLVDNQGYCCGVLVFIVMNSGRIFVMGEASVNAAPLSVPFYTYQDGSKGTSGKKMDDQNQYTATIKGMYNRPLIELVGQDPATFFALWA
jgi:hypothetical protein